MSEQNPGTAPAETSGQAPNPVFQIQRIYLKDVSLEQPNAPHILLSQEQPNVDIHMGVGVDNFAEHFFEVTITATITTTVGEKTLFLVEAKQAGIFEVRDVPDEQVPPLLGIVCPGIVYPYLRSNVSDLCTRAGFPPVTLAEMNFKAMFEAQQEQLMRQALEQMRQEDMKQAQGGTPRQDAPSA
jgi:preprotein translocase subunit SecB